MEFKQGRIEFGVYQDIMLDRLLITVCAVCKETKYTKGKTTALTGVALKSAWDNLILIEKATERLTKEVIEEARADGYEIRSL